MEIQQFLLGRDHTEPTKTKQEQKRDRTETIQKQNRNRTETKVKLIITHIQQNVKYFLDVLVYFSYPQLLDSFS